METEIIEQNKDILVIRWQKPGLGFGELTLRWDYQEQEFRLDTEVLGVDTILEIFKALK